MGGRLAALVLALAAIGLLSAGLVWVTFVVSRKARAAYRRFVEDRRG